MAQILISACLLGAPVRYDGASKPSAHALIERLRDQGSLLPICPELLGGLSTPRPAAEIVGPGSGDAVLDGSAKLLTAQGEDVTQAFIQGAQRALAFVQARNITTAILKAKSPSCGSSQIYDGSHSAQLIDGQGVTAALFRRHGIKVFHEGELDALATIIDAGDV